MPNLQRHLSKLNNLFLTELGCEPIYAWLYSGDQRLLHPMIVVDKETDKPKFVAVCQCGKGVSVHQPTCNFSWVEPETVIRLLTEDIKNQFVICNLQHPSKSEWQATFGSQHTYPAEGKWIPVDWNRVDPATGAIRAKGRLTAKYPTESLTWEFIKMVKESRTLTAKVLDYNSEVLQERKEKQRDENVRHEIREDLGVSVFPGKKEEVSFPTPNKDVSKPNN